MSVRTITDATAVGGNSLDGGTTTGPYFPTRSEANIVNVNLYDYTATNGLRFNDGAEIVVGKPVQSASGTLTNLNAPFIWDATAFGGDGGYVENENSIVASNADGTLVGIEERVTIVISGSNASNQNLFAGDDTCRPVFYGVDFVLDGYSNANVLGVAITGANVGAAPQFYDCRVFHTNVDGVHRYQAFNYLVRGLQLVSTNDNGAVYEAGAPPKVPAIGLSFVTPNFGSFGNRAALAFVNAAGGDAANRYVTNGLEAPAFPLYRGNAGAQVSPNRGAIHVNPVPSPVPWTLTAAAGNTTDVIPFMSFRTVDVDHVLGGGSSMEAQRVAFTFDEAGYTLRVRRAEVEVWNWRDTEPVAVQYAGLTKNSNGSLVRLTSSSANNTTLSMVDGQPTVENDTTQNLSYVNSAQVTNPVFQGYDVTVAGTDTVITLPVSHQLQLGGASGSTNADSVVKFFRWEIFAIHPQRGITQVMEYDFTPENQNATYGSGNNIDVNVTTPLDVLYTSDRDISTGGAITDGAYLHDAVKKYQVERNSATAYDASHLQSEVPVISSNGTQSDFGSRNIIFNPAGTNRVVSSADISSATAAITLKHSTNGIINTVDGSGAIEQKVTGLVTTGTLDLGEATVTRFDLEASSIDADNSTLNNATAIAASSITATGIGTISNQTLETGLISTVLGKLTSDNTYSGYQGTGNLAISFANLTDGASFTPEELLGTGYNTAGTGTITLQSPDADVTVVTNDSRISAGGGVTFVLPNATIDFSGILAAESTFFSNAKVAFAPLLTLGNETLITVSDLTNGIYTFSNLTEDAQYVVGVSKPGRTNSRQTFRFTGGNVVTPVLNTIDAVTENIALVPNPNPDNLPVPAITSTRVAGGKTIYGLSNATTMNSMDGPQTVWVTELMKGTDQYVADLVAGLDVEIRHTSTVDSEWDGSIFVMEPISANQQVTGISGGLGNPNPVQDNGTLSIFINGATEVNYGTIDSLFDENVAPIVTSLATIDDNVDDTKKWTKEMRENKLLGLSPQKAAAPSNPLPITGA